MRNRGDRTTTYFLNIPRYQSNTYQSPVMGAECAICEGGPLDPRTYRIHVNKFAVRGDLPYSGTE